MAEDSYFVERPDNEYLILALDVNGVERDAGIEAYLPETETSDNILIPLRSFADALSFAIEVNSGNGQAEGWFVKENRIFQLDINRNIVIVDGSEEHISLDGAEPHIDDIYVKAYLLERWFDTDIEFDMSTLTLYINSENSLPFQEQKQRRNKWDIFRREHMHVERQLENRKMLPYKLFSFPHFSVQQTVNVNKSSESYMYSTSSSVEAYMDLMKHSARYVMSSGYDKKNKLRINSAELTFKRQDPEKGLLGFFNAGEYSFGDISFINVPLFKGSDRGRGLYISSEPEVSLDISEEAGETFAIDGEAPIGWDAELYRNGHFIDFQVVSNESRFVFEGVRLLSGLNLFEVKLYGPEGQQDIMTKKVYRGSEMLTEGELKYEVVAGQPKAKFLPIVEDSPDDSALGVAGRLFYGLTKYLTVGVDYYVGPDEGEAKNNRTQAGTISAIASFLGLNTELQYMKASRGRSSYDAEIRGQFAKINTSFRYRENEGFDSGDRDMKKRMGLSLSRSFGFMNFSGLVEKKIFQEKEDELLFSGLVSLDFLGMKVTNKLDKVESVAVSQEGFDGELSIATELFGDRIRANFVYDLEDKSEDIIKSARFYWYRSLSDKDFLRITGQHEFETGVNSLNVKYSRNFSPYNIDFLFGASSDHNYHAGVNLRVALQPDLNKEYRFVDSVSGSKASVKVRAFIDNNGNGIFNEKDEPIEGLRFLNNRGGEPVTTDGNGMALISGLLETPTEFRIDKNSIQSINLRPVNDSFSLIPRRGSDSIIEFPFTLSGEIDGFIYSEVIDNEGHEVQKRQSGIEVSIVDRETGEEIMNTISEYDGYYIFSSVPLGNYLLKAMLPWPEGEVEAISREVSVVADSPYVVGFDIVIPDVE